MVTCSVEGGIARSPLPTRIGWFFLGVGIEEGSMMSPGRTIGSCVVVMSRLRFISLLYQTGEKGDVFLACDSSFIDVQRRETLIGTAAKGR